MEIKTPNSSAHYMPQLDGLRAFAVGAVLIRHFFYPERIGGVDFALLAVWLFFVLSGFLITGILLRSRDQVEYHGHQRYLELRQFYIRRFLRIFPLYYLVLSIAALLDLSDVRDTIFWHLAYASNYLFAIQGQYGSVTGHLWSLAVEEQFYLLWPALILFAPRRFLLKVIITAIAVGPTFRLFGHFLDFNWVTRYAVSPACLDSLAPSHRSSGGRSSPATRAGQRSGRSLRHDGRLLRCAGDTGAHADAGTRRTGESSHRGVALRQRQP